MTNLARVALAAALVALVAACGGGSGGGSTGSQGSTSCSAGAYTGADPAGDADGDGISNAAECAGGTNPAVADTDGDGLSDGAEITRGTSPTIADTDGDGLKDGAEIAAGTNPLLADTDADGLADGAERSAGTNPLVADTDADGLADGAEVALGTNPLVADTDGDGLKDGDEVALGFDPKSATSPGSSEVCDTLTACASDALVPVQWQDRLHGDYRLALPDDASASDLAPLPDGGLPARVYATAFDLATPQVAGFVLSMDEVVANGDPTAQLNALYTRLSAAVGQAGTPWTATELVAGRSVTSWDGFPAVVGARVNLTATSATAGAVRQATLARMAGLADGTFGGLPAGAFGAGPYVLSLEVLSRRIQGTDAHRVVVVAAVAPKAAFDNKTLQTRITASDLTGGTALGQSGDGEGTECAGMPVTGDSRADFVWMSDVSGSTADERDPIKASTAVVFDRLATLGIDFRMGVVRHTANHVTNEEPAGRLVSPGFTTDQATYATYWDAPGGDRGLEFGLTAIDDVVGPTGTALPRSATVQPTKLREGVKLVVVYVSDEHAQEVEYRTTAPAGGCAGVTDATKEDLTASELACVNQKVQPFIDDLKAQDAIAFGIIAPPPGGCATSQEVGWGYSQVIAALGGTYGSVCASDPGQTLDDIVTAVAGATSSFVLPSTPIAMTLKVVVTEASAPVCDPANPVAGRHELARSQVDGFDYDPVNNSLFFVGPNRPENGDTVTVSYREWSDVTSNPLPDPPPCTCGTCQPNYSCQPTGPATCACQVIPG